MPQSAFYKTIKAELKAAKCELVRRSHGHDIYRGLTGRTVTVPRKLDDKGVVHEIRKRAGLIL